MQASWINSLNCFEKLVKKCSCACQSLAKIEKFPLWEEGWQEVGRLTINAICINKMRCSINIRVTSHSKCRAANKWDIIVVGEGVCPKMEKWGEMGRLQRRPSQDLWPQMQQLHPLLTPPLSNAKFMFIWDLRLGSRRIFMLWPMFILFELYVSRCLFIAAKLFGFMVVFLLYVYFFYFN